MGMEFRQVQKMSQTMVMTPRMQQAIKLLQYNHLEMAAHVQEQLLENPTLEALEGSDGYSASDSEIAMRDKAQKTQDEHTESRNGDEGNVDWEGLLNHINGSRTGLSGQSSGGTIHDDLPPIETNLTYGESLSDHLQWQLKMVPCTDAERIAAEVIILNLDGRGYLTATDEEVMAEAECDQDEFDGALEIVQGLDPVGCGARTLSETLVIQARLRFPEDENFKPILAEHLGDLEKRNYAAIAKALDLDVEDVVEYHKMIRELEPHPGREYSGDEPRYITPDLRVHKVGGEWVVQLNEEGMPELRVSKYYQKVLSKASKEDKEYLVDKLRGAEFLIKSIHRRRKTICDVMVSILKYQRDFFERGVEGLRPLVLQDVADEVGVHMSTVSRVTSNKYVDTPHGIYELKYFFSVGVKQSSGEDLAAAAIKSKIKALVAAENPKKPLSDSAMVTLLKKDGIKVARRTVAKYREAMGILSSTQRKQMF